MRPSFTLRLLALGIALVYVGVLIGFTLGFADGVPAGAWVGFGVVAAVVSALAVGTIVVFERIDLRAGTSADLVVPPVSDGPKRVPVVADVGCEEGEACERVVSRIPSPSAADVFVVAPTIATPLHHLMDDEGRERVSAGRRLEKIVALLNQRGITAHGMVGSDLPLEAIQDAMSMFPADEIIILAPPPEASEWSEHDLARRAESTFSRPVTHVAVPRGQGSPA